MLNMISENKKEIRNFKVSFFQNKPKEENTLKNAEDKKQLSGVSENCKNEKPCEKNKNKKSKGYGT